MRGREGRGRGKRQRRGRETGFTSYDCNKKKFLGLKAKASVQIEIPRMEVLPPNTPLPPPPPLCPELRNPEMRRFPPSSGHPPTPPLKKKKFKVLYKMWGRTKGGGRGETKEGCPHLQGWGVGMGVGGLRQQKLREWGGLGWRVGPVPTALRNLDAPGKAGLWRAGGRSSPVVG